MEEMETEVSEQAISHIQLTLPKTIFQVSHLLSGLGKPSVDFFATDSTGEFTRQIHISKPDDDHICVSLSVDNLTFEANRLCFAVDTVKPQNDQEVEEILSSARPSPVVQLQVPSTTDEPVNTSGETDGGLTSRDALHVEIRTAPAPTVKRKRGRPKKDDPNWTPKIKPSKPEVEEKENEEDYLTTPSGRKIRKPERYRVDVEDIDEAVKQEDPDVLLSPDEYDEDDMIDPDFTAPLHINVSDEEIDEADEDAATGDQEETGRGEDAANPGQPKPVKITKIGPPIKRKRGRPRLLRLPDRHQRSHGGRGMKRPNYKREANIECKLCHKFYKDELSLIGHVTKLHPDSAQTKSYIEELKEQAKVTCQLCGKVLGNKRNEMTSHMMRVHGQDDDFVSKCDECGMEFRRTFLLKEHKRRQHPKHERILCHLCPASFKLKEYLTEHLKYTHNKQYKWQCEICHKMTSSPKNLRRHKRLHDGAAFQCPVCTKVFHEAGNMKRHILYVHNATTVERHQCQHCDRDFSTKNNLIQHVNSVHLKTTSFYCDICKKYFCRKKQLIDHAQIVHPGVPILSTRMDDQPSTGAPYIGSIQDTVDLGEGLVDGSATIIVQGADGTQHVLTQQQLSQLGVTGLDDMPSADLMTSSAGHQYSSTIDEASLNIAQQALVALEQAGGAAADALDYGGEQYLNVLGEDGQEIRVQIIRKSDDDHPIEGTSITVQTVDGTNLTLSAPPALHEETLADCQPLHVVPEGAILDPTQEHLQAHQEELQSHEQHLQHGVTLIQEHLHTDATHEQSETMHHAVQEGHLQTQEGHLQTQDGHLQTSKGHLPSPDGHLQTSEGHLQTSEGHMQTPEGHLPDKNHPESSPHVTDCGS